MLVPAMQSMGTRSSSNTSSTPRCAPPRAPPPPSTSPMRGRSPVAACPNAAVAPASSTAASARLEIVMASILFSRAPRLDFERERREPRVAIVVVLVLGALERAHDRVGHRREHHLDADLADEL